MLYLNPNPCHSFKRHQLLAAPSSAGWDPTKAPAGGSSDAQNGGCGRARPRGRAGRTNATGMAAVVRPAATGRRGLGVRALLRVCVSFALIVSLPCGAVPRSQLVLFACFLLEKFKRGV